MTPEQIVQTGKAMLAHSDAMIERVASGPGVVIDTFPRSETQFDSSLLYVYYRVKHEPKTRPMNQKEIEAYANELERVQLRLDKAEKIIAEVFLASMGTEPLAVRMLRISEIGGNYTAEASAGEELKAQSLHPPKTTVSSCVMCGRRILCPLDCIPYCKACGEEIEQCKNIRT